MINIPKVKVLRYTQEELYHIRAEERAAGRVEEFKDWFTPVVERRFPKWKVLAALHQYDSDYVWVIMTKANFEVTEYQVLDARGKGKKKEEVKILQ